MLADVLANTQGDAGGFSIINLLLPLALAFLIFTMFRRQRKSQQQVKEMRTQMEPGTQVMTQFGLFGTILSVDQENNKAVLELSPGNTATVHTQALAKVVEQTQEPVVAEDTLDTFEGTEVPNDASSLEDVDGPRTSGNSAPTATAGGSSSVETPEETIARLEREHTGENPDAPAPRDPKTNPND